jgi:hypothetical protein
MSAFRSFGDFWPHYLREHARPATRLIHVAGTSLVIIIGLAALALRSWWLFAAMPVAGYGFAWASHFAVERNRPATFTHPLWSLRADFRMWRLWLTGGLGAELRAAGIAVADAKEARDGRG